MNILILAPRNLDLSGVNSPRTDFVEVIQFDSASDVTAAFAEPADAVVVVSDSCSKELLAEIAAVVRRLDRRVIEVQGEASTAPGNPLSAACTGVIAGFGIAAGVSAAIAALDS